MSCFCCLKAVLSEGVCASRVHSQANMFPLDREVRVADAFGSARRATGRGSAAGHPQPPWSPLNVASVVVGRGVEETRPVIEWLEGPCTKFHEFVV